MPILSLVLAMQKYWWSVHNMQNAETTNSIELDKWGGIGMVQDGEQWCKLEGGGK